jgi:hypothetical protein
VQCQQQGVGLACTLQCPAPEPPATGRSCWVQVVLRRVVHPLAISNYSMGPLAGSIAARTASLTALQARPGQAGAGE